MERPFHDEAIFFAIFSSFPGFFLHLRGDSLNWPQREGQGSFFFGRGSIWNFFVWWKRNKKGCNVFCFGGLFLVVDPLVDERVQAVEFSRFFFVGFPCILYFFSSISLDMERRYRSQWLARFPIFFLPFLFRVREEKNIYIYIYIYKRNDEKKERLDSFSFHGTGVFYCRDRFSLLLFFVFT